MPMIQTRRRFLGTAALAGAAAALPLPSARAEEPGLETTSIKLSKTSAICTMPADDHPSSCCEAEGFIDIRYVDVPPVAGTEPLARDDVDLLVHYASNFIVGLDKGETLTLLAGVHVGCYRVVRQRTRPQHRRSEGKDRRRAGVRIRAGICC